MGEGEFWVCAAQNMNGEMCLGSGILFMAMESIIELARTGKKTLEKIRRLQKGKGQRLLV